MVTVTGAASVDITSDNADVAAAAYADGAASVDITSDNQCRCSLLLLMQMVLLQ